MPLYHGLNLGRGAAGRIWKLVIGIEQTDTELNLALVSITKHYPNGSAARPAAVSDPVV